MNTWFTECQDGSVGLPAPALTIEPGTGKGSLVASGAGLGLSTSPCSPAPCPAFTFGCAPENQFVLLGNLRLIDVISQISCALLHFWDPLGLNVRLMNTPVPCWQMGCVSLLPLSALLLQGKAQAGCTQPPPWLSPHGLVYYLCFLVKMTPGPLSSRFCLCPALLCLLRAILCALPLPLPASPVISAFPLGSFSR